MKFFITCLILSWTFILLAQESEIVRNNPMNNFELGQAVDISEDGQFAIAGLAGTGTSTGRAYIYTLINGIWTKSAELTASDGGVGDDFGRTVSISHSGVYAAIGAPFEDEDGINSGAVYIFYFDGNGWTQQAKLKASDQAQEDQFGHAVSISDDGQYVVVGAIKKDASALNFDSGAAYVFNRSDETWAEQSKLNPLTLRREDEFGTAVSIDRTGENIIVSSPLDDDQGVNSGSVYAFKRVDETWTMTVEFRASNPSTGAKFGAAIAMNADATRAVVGAPLANNTTGSVYIFFKTSNGWMQMDSLNPDNVDSNQGFGESVGISQDGHWLVVGAPRDNTNANRAGAVYVYKGIINDWSWEQRCKTVATFPGINYEYGHAVAISDAGNQVFVGSPFADDYGANSGAVYAFEIVNENCTNPQFIPHGASFGHSVDISRDGNYCLIGAPFMTQNGQTSGAVYVYRNNAGTWVEEAQLLSTDISSGDRFGWSLAVNADGSQCVIGASRANSTTRRSGAAYVFNRTGSNWLQVAKLTPNSAMSNDEFGSAVDISEEAEVVVVGVAGNDFEAENSGTAYVFSAADLNWTRQRILARIDAAVGDRFGAAVSINTDGTYAMVGAPYAGAAGRLYPYSFSTFGQWSRLTAVSPSISDGVDLAYGASLDLNDAGNKILVGAPGTTDNTNYKGAAYILNLSNGNWLQAQKIEATDGLALDAFGTAVSLANDETFLAVGATGQDAGAMNGGATYIYESGTGIWQQSNKIIAADIMEQDAFGTAVAIDNAANHLVIGSPLHDHTGVDNGAAYKYQDFQVLAIYLLRFDVFQKEEAVQVTWQLADVEQVEQFVVQRSTDLVTFENINTIASKTYQTVYTYTDKQVKSGETYYYRLMTVEMDGQQNLSIIQSVHLLADVQIQVYPNPVQEQLHISSIDDENTWVEIWTMTGQLIRRTTVQQYVNVADLVAGTYVLKIIRTSSEKETSVLFVKE